MTKRDKPIKLSTLDTNQYRRWADTAKQTFEIYKVFDVVNGSSPDPTPPNVDSDNPNSPTFLALTPNQRKTISDWKYRNLLAQEAITNALSPEDYNSVGHLKYASEIWSRLKQEYGQTFDICRAVAGTEFHTLKKHKSTPMEEHIRKFKKLRAELNYQRPVGVLPMERALVNLAFLTSLITGDDETEDTIWRNFRAALGDNISTMLTEQLLTRVRAHEATRIRPPISTSDQASPASPSTHTDAQAMTTFIPKNQFKNLKGKKFHLYKNKHRSDFNFNFKFDRSKYCAYCKQNGHGIHECLKKKYIDIQYPRKLLRNNNSNHNNSRNGNYKDNNSNQQGNGLPQWQANVAKLVTNTALAQSPSNSNL